MRVTVAGGSDIEILTAGVEVRVEVSAGRRRRNSDTGVEFRVELLADIDILTAGIEFRIEVSADVGIQHGG